MLFTLLLVLLILDSLVLITAILLQAGKGGGLAANFGGATSSADAVIGTRQAGNLLTKASWWCGGVFLFLAFVLQIMSTRTRQPTSVLDRPISRTPAPAAPSTAPSSAVPLTPTKSVEAAPAPAATQPKDAGSQKGTPPPPAKK
jgi:preprotein translocase subunit SecG